MLVDVLTDQSIGGALATGSHGSSMGEGSIASQVVAVTVALANGTVMEITAADHPHLMRAWGVSIGRLGILLDLTLKISHNVNVRRSNRVMPSGEFVQHMKDVQRAYNTNGESAQVSGRGATLTPASVAAPATAPEWVSG